MMAYEGLSSLLDFESMPDPGDRFKMGDLIGEGTYGEVYRAVDTQSPTGESMKWLENWRIVRLV